MLDRQYNHLIFAYEQKAVDQGKEKGHAAIMDDTRNSSPNLSMYKACLRKTSVEER